MVYTQVLEINIYNNNDDVLKNQDEDEIICGWSYPWKESLYCFEKLWEIFWQLGWTIISTSCGLGGEKPFHV